MKNYKQLFLNDIECALVDIIPPSFIPTIINETVKALNNYEITEKCTDIVVYDDQNQKLVKRFRAFCFVRGLSESTVSQYTALLRKFLGIVPKNLTEVKSEDIMYFLAILKTRGIKDITLNNYRNYLSTFFTWLYDAEFVDRNPIRQVKPIKYKKEVKKPFTEVEIDKLRSACKNARERALIELLLSSGARCNEVACTNIDDLDFSTCSYHIKHGKGNKERITFFTPVASMYLQEYLGNRKDCLIYLFPSRLDKKINKNSIKFIIHNIGNRVGISECYPHKFRRTFATTMYKRGMSIQEIQKLMGHANISTTMGYIYSDVTDLKEAYNKYA